MLIRTTEKVNLPDGKYQGRWSGNEVKILNSVGGNEELNIKTETEQGVRGMNIAIIISIENGWGWVSPEKKESSYTTAEIKLRDHLEALINSFSDCVRRYQGEMNRNSNGDHLLYRADLQKAKDALVDLKFKDIEVRNCA